MDWIESLKYIRKAQENNQLVIFVGAGVSANSNIPSWKNLVREIAEEINTVDVLAVPVEVPNLYVYLFVPVNMTSLLKS